MATPLVPHGVVGANGSQPLLTGNAKDTVICVETPPTSSMLDGQLRYQQFRMTVAGGGPSPESRAPFWRRITFSWLNPLIAEGNAREEQHITSQGQAQASALLEDDLYELPRDDLPHSIRDSIEGAWRHELSRPHGSRSLQRALSKAFGQTLLFGGCYKFLYDSLQMVGPFVLKRFLAYLKTCSEREQCNMAEGLPFVMALMVTALIQTILLQQYFHCGFRTGMRLNCATICLIYGKALKIGGLGQLSTEQHQQRTTGDLLNFMSVDAQRLQDLMTYFCTIWSGPYQIMISLTFLSFVVGWATLGGLSVLLVQIPLTTCVARRVKVAQRALMKAKDDRIKKTEETFGAIRLLKMYGWEDSFERRVDDARELELRQLRRYQVLNIFTTCLFAAIPLLTGAATFSIYTHLYGELDAGTAFTALALFNVLRFPLNMFPNVVTSVVEANVALKRIQPYLESPEIEVRTASSQNGRDQPAVEIRQASFAWPDGTSLLRGVTFSVPAAPRNQKQAHLTVVVGAVGAGKSGLLQALIGDLRPEAGSLSTSGTIAYAAQVAWIRNATVKHNIIFNSFVDEERYQAVLKACCLLPDLDALPNRDETEIGEKGVNLSGGQKQRIALARAVYASAELLLLDDVLSAVDSEVANQLLSMLRGPLVAGSSIVLCTHYLSALHHADQVVLLERGDHEEGNGHSAQNSHYGRAIVFESAMEFTRRYPNYIPKAQVGAMAVSDAQMTPAKAGTSAGRLVEKEVEQVGSVPFSVYRTYIQAAGGSWLTCAVVFGVVLGQAVQTAADSWVSYWSDHSDQNNANYMSSGTGLVGYISFSFGAFFVIFATSALFRLTALNAARFFHRQLLEKLLHLPVVFFDTEPLGRILNRLSKDIYTIDEQLQTTLYQQLSTFARVVATMAVIAFATPWFLLIIVPLLVLYRKVQNYYIPTSRQLKRIESVLRSPIFSHFSESLDGVASIRAFGQQEQFIAENLDRLQRNMRAYYLNVSSNRWLAIRLETLGTGIVTAAGLLAVFDASSVSAGMAGLSISYALSVTQSLNWCVRMASQREINIVSVERVHQYLQKENEPAHRLGNDPPPGAWPTRGAISFQQVKLRYRPELPLVLDGLSLEVRAGEKLGVCGRTGAGKSSVLNALLRIVQLEAGKVLIDDIDITTIGLHRLRHSISIIPQDPVLFSGTLTFNLDPLGEVQEKARVSEALRRSHLASHASTLASHDARNTLGSQELEVAEKGQNFSVGQRQQICLARALLRESNRILLLDEATSSVDAATDELIQETLRSEFATHTVLCIAHRISTIMESDRVCVLENGSLKELGPPKELRERPDSIFRKLAMMDATSSS